MHFEGMPEPNPIVNIDLDPKLTTKPGPDLDPGKIISDPQRSFRLLN
jgi:hypothetical protein